MNDADERDMDVVTVTRDAALLDALGRGEPPPVDDEVAVLLAAWRAELAADVPAGDIPGVRTAVPAPAGPASAARSGRPRRPLMRASVAAAAALVAIAGALTVGAAGAGPDSPLWPITRVVYEERADSRTAQHQAEGAIARARTAVTETRYTDAARLLDEADGLIDRVRDQRVAQRLHGEVAVLRALLPGAPVPGAPVPGAPVPGATPSPSAGVGQPSAATTPNPAQPAGGDSGAPALPLPGVSVPGLPLPTVTLPSLPLIGG